MLNQYKIVYRQNGGRFRVFVDAQTLEKAITEFRRKSSFSLVEIIDVVYVKTHPLSKEHQAIYYKLLNKYHTFFGNLSSGLKEIVKKYE